MESKEVIGEMYRTLAGAVLLVAFLLWAGSAGAGGALEQAGLPQGATDRVWGLVSDEAIKLALVMAAGILGAIGLVGAVRLAKRKPTRSCFGPNEGFAYQTAYDDWHHFMKMVATYGGMALIFALELVALEGRYGWFAKIVVALTPALIGGFLVPPTYNYVKEKGRQWGLIAAPVDTDGDGVPDDDETRKL